MAITIDSKYMKKALKLAMLAAEAGEVPVGAVVVDKTGTIIGEGYNRMEQARDATQHAELIALQQAAATKGAWRLKDCILYVTLEPCPMCAGAMVQSQLGALVFGAPDSKAGAAGSLFNLVDSPLLNHRLEVVGGILAEECSSLLRDFFARRRQQGKITQEQEKKAEEGSK